MKPKDLIGIPWMLAFALRADGWYLRSPIVWAKPNGMPGSQQDRCTSSYEHVFLLSKQAQYFSDFDAIKTPPREASLVRLAQDVQAQRGSHRANGGEKTNGSMKAVGGALTGAPHGRHSLGDQVPALERRADKQRGHSRQHAGFNDRWDAMSKAKQQSQPVMMRDVWFVSPGGYDGAHFAVMPEEIAARCILAGSRPGDVVFDPFFGSGTTGQVAQRLGRHFIGCELNRDNDQLQRDRLQQPGFELFTA
ncbi:MAG: site-specific DNA-methyltransferase [Pararobbsia sp.]